MLRVAVLISGSGTNLQALLDACADPDFAAEICLVISNRPDAYGLTRAREAGVRTTVIEHKKFADRPAFDQAIDGALREADIELVCLAGFMRILTEGFVEGWKDRMINIHPSLLPSFKGLDTHRRAIEAGVRITGCTVHFVRPAMDDGPIIVQAAVPVLQDDDPDTLAGRVLEMEHRIYPLALGLIADGRVSVDGDRSVLTRTTPSCERLINPSPDDLR